MTTNMKVAPQSNALVALHIRNSTNADGNISTEVPVRNIVRTRNVGESLTNSVLVSNLRAVAVTALLESEPTRPIPAHSLEYFELSSYQRKDGTILSPQDNTLSQVLESSVTVNIHDSDEGVVLHIFCAFASKYHSSYKPADIRKIRASAAAAGGRERKRLATNLQGWAADKRRSVADNVATKREYIAIPYANNPHPLQLWRDRVVNLVVPEGMEEKEFIRQKADAARECAETTVEYLVEQAIWTSEVICHYATPYHLQPRQSTRVVPRSEFNFNKEESKENEECEEGVEVVFEPIGSHATPSEWNIIFEIDEFDYDSIGSMESLEEGLVIGSLDSEDGLIIDSIDAKDGIIIDSIDVEDVIIIDSIDAVQSLSSNQSTKAKNNTTDDNNLSYDSLDSSLGAISIDDDTSWTILDDED